MTASLAVAQADLDAVETIVRKAGTSFYRGMRVLPPDRRQAMYAIYAFCRIVDDIADEEGAMADKRRDLAAWRDRVAGLYRGRADDPVTRGETGDARAGSLDNPAELHPGGEGQIWFHLVSTPAHQRVGEVGRRGEHPDEQLPGRRGRTLRGGGQPQNLDGLAEALHRPCPHERPAHRTAVADGARPTGWPPGSRGPGMPWNQVR